MFAHKTALRDGLVALASFGFTTIEFGGFTILLVAASFALNSALLSLFGIRDPLVLLLGSALVFLLAAPRLLGFLDI